MTFDLGSFEALSFDCYGTLIDWETGIVKALKTVLAAHGLTGEPEQLLAQYARLESGVEADGYRPYREVLQMVLSGLGKELGFTPTEPELTDFGESPRRWPPFPDSGVALRELQSHYRLVILSNIDDDLFAASEAALGVKFDEIITAQQIGAYKPNPLMFEALLSRCGCKPDRLLHVAQSLFHDIGPAGEFGLKRVWVNRRGGRAGSGATPAASGEIRPDLEVGSLAELARIAIS